MRTLTVKMWTVRVIATVFGLVGCANLFVPMYYAGVGDERQPNGAMLIILLGACIAIVGAIILLNVSGMIQAERNMLVWQERESATRAREEQAHLVSEARTNGYYEWKRLGMPHELCHELAEVLDLYDPIMVMDTPIVATQQRVHALTAQYTELKALLDDVFNAMAPEGVMADVDQLQIAEWATPTMSADELMQEQEREWNARHTVYLQSGGQYGRVMPQQTSDLPWMQGGR